MLCGRQKIAYTNKNHTFWYLSLFENLDNIANQSNAENFWTF
jgi:hypothetical protein